MNRGLKPIFSIDPRSKKGPVRTPDHDPARPAVFDGPAAIRQRIDEWSERGMAGTVEGIEGKSHVFASPSNAFASRLCPARR